MKREQTFSKKLPKSYHLGQMQLICDVLNGHRTPKQALRESAKLRKLYLAGKIPYGSDGPRILL